MANGGQHIGATGLQKLRFWSGRTEEESRKEIQSIKGDLFSGHKISWINLVGLGLLTGVLRYIEFWWNPDYKKFVKEELADLKAAHKKVEQLSMEVKQARQLVGKSLFSYGDSQQGGVAIADQNELTKRLKAAEKRVEDLSAPTLARSISATDAPLTASQKQTIMQQSMWDDMKKQIFDPGKPMDKVDPEKYGRIIDGFEKKLDNVNNPLMEVFENDFVGKLLAVAQKDELRNQIRIVYNLHTYSLDSRTLSKENRAEIKKLLNELYIYPEQRS